MNIASWHTRTDSMQPTLGDYLRAAGGANGRKDNLLLLRLIAATLVIYGHGFALAALGSGQVDWVSRYLGYRYSGDIAVALFFVISGFLVTGSLDRRGSTLGFLAARAIRLFPALLVCLIVCALVMGPLVTTKSASEYWADPMTWSYIRTNFFLVDMQWFLPGVFEHNRYGAPVNGSLWTLPIEARMYLCVAVFGLLRLVSFRWTATCIVIAMVIWAYQPGQLDPLGGFEAARLMAFFACGALFYLHKDWLPLNFGLLAALGLIAWGCRSSVYYEFAFSAALAYGIFWAAYVPVIPLPAWVQDISYGTYLYGWPIQQLIAQWDPTTTPHQMTAIAIPLTWAVALLSWHLVEKPALALHKAWRTKRPSPSVMPNMPGTRVPPT